VTRVQRKSERKRGASGHHLAAQYIATEFSSRQAYAEAKIAFITHVVERALSEGYPRA
jgi:hypothetical protein